MGRLLCAWSPVFLNLFLCSCPLEGGIYITQIDEWDLMDFWKEVAGDFTILTPCLTLLPRSKSYNFKIVSTWYWFTDLFWDNLQTCFFSALGTFSASIPFLLLRKSYFSFRSVESAVCVCVFKAWAHQHSPFPLQLGSGVKKHPTWATVC